MYTKKKNRTLAETVAEVHFYVSLTGRTDFAVSGKDFLGIESHFVGTGIGLGATGILGVFRGCTSRRRYMYI